MLLNFDSIYVGYVRPVAWCGRTILLEHIVYFNQLSHPKQGITLEKIVILTEYVDLWQTVSVNRDRCQ